VKQRVQKKSISSRSTKPAQELIYSANQLEVSYGPILFKGLSLADIAHVFHLMESHIIPKTDARKLLIVLLDLHKIPSVDFVFDPILGDAYKNRERYITNIEPDAGGWLRTGRARREATNIAFQIAVRERLLTLHHSLIDVAQALTNLAAEHINTIMPDFTYLQHAQPTTFAHYLLGFTFPVLRDLDRLQACFQRVNKCSGGIGSVNGSRLPIDRKRLAKLLGFESAVMHTRDAMWQADLPVEILAAVVASVINIDRLGEDIQIWVTQEFDLVDLSDAYCRESVIMPQKKNPYSLAFIRGVAGVLTGQMTAMANVGRTVSGQPDNRIFAYGDVPRSLDLAIQSAQLMAGVINTLSVNVDVMARRAEEGYSQATDLAEVIMIEANIPYLIAHRVITQVVRTASQKAIPALKITSKMIDSAAKQILGYPLKVSPDIIRTTLCPKNIVASRVGFGGAAPHQVKKMIAEIHTSILKARQWHDENYKHIVDAEMNLIKNVSALCGSAFVK
jgi:argininosuccinate lyase